MMSLMALIGMALMGVPGVGRQGGGMGSGGQGGAGGYDPGTTDTFVQNKAFTTSAQFSPDSYQDSTAFDYFSPNSAASASFTDTSFNDATSSSSSYDTSSSFTDTSSADSLSSWDPSTFDVSSNDSSYFSGGDYFSAPVVLDLTGNGIKITQLSRHPQRRKLPREGRAEPVRRPRATQLKFGVHTHNRAIVNSNALGV